MSVELKAIEDLKKFIQERHRLPSLNTENQVEKTLAEWVMYYLLHKPEGKSQWDTFTQTDEFTFFFTDPNIIWKFTLEIFSWFIKKNGRHPNPSARNFTERRLAIWAERNRYSSKSSKGIMKSVEIQQLWNATDY